MTVLISAIPYNILVQIFLTIRVFNLACEYAALIRLRYTEPNTKRPFIVPGGLVGAWLLGVPSAILAGVCVATADWEAWAAGGIVNAFIGVSFLSRMVYRKFIAKEDSPNGADLSVNRLDD